MTDEVLVERAAEGIADGRAPDWELLQAACSNDAGRALLRELRALAAVADVAQHYDAPALERWGRLIVLERVGAGAFGEVWRAWDPQLERAVALKLFSQGATSPERALAEARRLARVRHPGIPIVFGVDEHEGRAGLWMELVEGDTLAGICARSGPLDVVDAAQIAIAVADALAAVHQAGLLHGDIKPQNIVRESAGRVVLTDFGLGRDRTTDAHDGIGGTPLYLAPELLAGCAPSTASDIYALGVTLFFLLTGTHPVTASSLTELLRAHRAPPASRPRIPRRLARVVLRAIDTDPAGRPQSAEALRDDLARALRSLERRRVAHYGAAAALLLATLLLSLFLPSAWRATPRSAPAPDLRPSPAPALQPEEPLATAERPSRRKDPFMTSLAALADPALRSAAGALYSVSVSHTAGNGTRPATTVAIRASTPLHVYAFTEGPETELRLVRHESLTLPMTGVGESGQRLSLQTSRARPAILLITPYPLRELEELARRRASAGAPPESGLLPAAERAALRRLALPAERAARREHRLSDALRQASSQVEVVRGVYARVLAAPGD